MIPTLGMRDEYEDTEDIEDSDPDGFETVTNGRKSRKRKKRNFSIESLKAHDSDSSFVEARTEPLSPPNNPLNPMKILIVPIEKTKSLNRCPPSKIAKSVEKCAGNNSVTSIKPYKNGILVECKNTKQLNQLSQIQEVASVPVKIQPRTTLLRGVIYGISIDVDDEELLQELKSQKVVSVKRMTKVNRDQPEQKTPLRTVILFFDTNKLPEKIHLWYQIFEVKPFIPRVNRCFNCQRLGHTANSCQAKQRCVRCGGPHSFQECERKDNPICVRCKENHSAAYNGCNVMKKAKEVLKISILEKITYAQAVDKYKKGEKEKATNNAHLSPDTPLQTQMHNQKPNPSLNIDPPNEIPSSAGEDSHRDPPAKPRNAQRIETQPKVPLSRNYKSAPTAVNPNQNFMTTAKNEDILTFIFTLFVRYDQKSTKEEFMDILISLTSRIFPNVRIDKKQLHDECN